MLNNTILTFEDTKAIYMDCYPNGRFEEDCDGNVYVTPDINDPYKYESMRTEERKWRKIGPSSTEFYIECLRTEFIDVHLGQNGELSYTKPSFMAYQ